MEPARKYCSASGRTKSNAPQHARPGRTTRAARASWGTLVAQRVFAWRSVRRAPQLQRAAPGIWRLAAATARRGRRQPSAAPKRKRTLRRVATSPPDMPPPATSGSLRCDMRKTITKSSSPEATPRNKKRCRNDRESAGAAMVRQAVPRLVQGAQRTHWARQAATQRAPRPPAPLRRCWCNRRSRCRRPRTPKGGVSVWGAMVALGPLCLSFAGTLLARCPPRAAPPVNRKPSRCHDACLQACPPGAGRSRAARRLLHHARGAFGFHGRFARAGCGAGACSRARRAAARGRPCTGGHDVGACGVAAARAARALSRPSPALTTAWRSHAAALPRRSVGALRRRQGACAPPGPQGRAVQRQVSSCAANRRGRFLVKGTAASAKGALRRHLPRRAAATC